MRTMLKAQLNIETASLAIGDGSINDIFGKVFGLCQPEATYFMVENGLRTVIAIFDLKSPDMIPALAEPLFQGLGATVDMWPVMSADELQKGLMAK